jgi:hypothetical protein
VTGKWLGGYTISHWWVWSWSRGGAAVRVELVGIGGVGVQGGVLGGAGYQEGDGGAVA